MLQLRFMAAFPSFRNSIVANRASYTLLDNTESDADSIRRRSVSSQHRTQSSPILCDKCWIRQERSCASKRCRDCKQNLCSVCAHCDEVPRPWWIPSWMVQCLRFLFTKAYIPHSIVDLQCNGNNARPHWAHTQEASSIQRIPRVTQSSLRSNKSTVSVDTNNSSRTKSPKTSSFSHAKKGNRESIVKSLDSRSNVRLHHSQSVDGKGRRRYSNVNPKRSRSSEELTHKLHSEDLDKLERYNRNWEIDFSEKSTNYDNDSVEPNYGRRYRNKMKGTDVNIEFTDTKEIKVIVNTTEDDCKDQNLNKCAIPKSKLNKKTKHNIPKNYTENIFQEVPIWFKKSSKYPTNVQHTDTNVLQYKSQNTNKQLFPHDIRQDITDKSNNINIPEHGAYTNNATFTEALRQPTTESSNKRSPRQNTSDPDVCVSSNNSARDETNIGKLNAAYIVEAPSDSCPICLEELPGNEARELACSHVIHTQCLTRYLRKMELDFGIRCPLCTYTTSVRNYYAPKEHWYKELPVSTTV